MVLRLFDAVFARLCFWRLAICVVLVCWWRVANVSVLFSDGIVLLWLRIRRVLVVLSLLLFVGGVFVVRYCVLVVCWCRVGHVLVLSSWCGGCGGWVSINQSI